MGLSFPTYMFYRSSVLNADYALKRENSLSNTVNGTCLWSILASYFDALRVQVYLGEGTKNMTL